MATKRLDEEIVWTTNTPVLDNLQRLTRLIELRLQGLENLRTTLDDVISGITTVGLQRINETFTPLLIDAQTRLENFGANFTAGSSTSNAVELGEKVFFIPVGQREAFIYGDFESVRAVGVVPSAFMVGAVTGFDRPSGMLTLNIITAEGSGTHADWDIRMTLQPDLTHATRVDNPHQTTADQVGAYTFAQTNAAMAAVIASSLQRDANLADITSPATARASLGLQSAATKVAGGGANEVLLLDAAGKVPQANYAGFQTGDGVITLRTLASPGWVPANDGTIGDLNSGANTRANLDTRALFDVLYALDDAAAPLFTRLGVPTTRAAQGTNTQAWGNLCRMSLTKQLGRSIAIAGAGAGLSNRILGRADGAEFAALSAANNGPHAHNIFTNSPLLGGDGQTLALADGPVQYTFYWPKTIISGNFGSTDASGSGAPFSIVEPRSYWNVHIKL